MLLVANYGTFTQENLSILNSCFLIVFWYNLFKNILIQFIICQFLSLKLSRDFQKTKNIIRKKKLVIEHKASVEIFLRVKYST